MTTRERIEISLYSGSIIIISILLGVAQYLR